MTRSTIHPVNVTKRRGLTLLELMLALSITAITAGAIASMMGAVSVGVNSRRDGRATMIRASAASARLEAYVAPSRCILGDTNPLLVIWFDDSRESGTVHATEIRWMVYDADAGTIDLCFIEFPEAWTQVQKDLADLEYVSSTKWANVLAAYDTAGHIMRMPIVEGLDTVSILSTEADPLLAEHIVFDLAFTTSVDAVGIQAGATIRIHEPPDS